MKTANPLLTLSVKAAENLTKNLCVTNTGEIASAQSTFLGVCYADTDQNEEAPIIAKGTALCIASQAITAGSVVVADDNGKVAPASATTFTKDIVGLAQDEAAADGDTIRVLLR